MNYDLDTKEGLANAVAWTNNTLALLRDGGQWAVPRSGTIITVHNGLDKRYSIASDQLDPSLTFVLAAAGWTCESAIINAIGVHHE